MGYEYFDRPALKKESRKLLKDNVGTAFVIFLLGLFALLVVSKALELVKQQITGAGKFEFTFDDGTLNGLANSIFGKQTISDVTQLDVWVFVVGFVITFIAAWIVLYVQRYVFYLFVKAGGKEKLDMNNIIESFKNNPKLIPSALFGSFYILVCVFLPNLIINMVAYKFVGDNEIIMMTVMSSVEAVFMIVAIILYLQISQISYIIFENPDMKVIDAFKLSKKMMAGHKGELFVTTFSFIPWYLLSILTLFTLIPIYVQPYLETTYVNYYFYLKGEHEKKIGAGVA